jgi:hypothetical protein
MGCAHRAAASSSADRRFRSCRQAETCRNCHSFDKAVVVGGIPLDSDQQTLYSWGFPRHCRRRAKAELAQPCPRHFAGGPHDLTTDTCATELPRQPSGPQVMHPLSRGGSGWRRLTRFWQSGRPEDHPKAAAPGSQSPQRCSRCRRVRKRQQQQHLEAGRRRSSWVKVFVLWSLPY